MSEVVAPTENPSYKPLSKLERIRQLNDVDKVALLPKVHIISCLRW